MVKTYQYLNSIYCEGCFCTPIGEYCETKYFKPVKTLRHGSKLLRVCLRLKLGSKI